MLTLGDINKLSTIFATKQELQQIREEMATKEDLADLQSKVLTLLDEVMGEVKTMRQEQTMHSYAHVRINDDIDEVKTRVTILEEA